MAALADREDLAQHAAAVQMLCLKSGCQCSMSARTCMLTMCCVLLQLALREQELTEVMVERNELSRRVQELELEVEHLSKR